MNTSDHLDVLLRTESVSNFHTIDYVIFGVLLALSVSIGVYFGFFDGTKQTVEEYLLGGRNMKTLPVAISLVASQLSAFTIISIPSEIYSYGSHYMFMDMPGVIFTTLMVNYGILPVFYENDISNCYAYLEMRFGKAIRSLITGLFMLVILMFLPITSFHPAIAFSQITGLNIHMINALVILACVSYTMLGGVKAVVWTDVVQAFVMIFSIVTVLVFAVRRVGGYGEVIERAIAGDRLAMIPIVLDLTTRQTVWNLGTGLFLNWVTYLAFNQSCVQRLSALPSLKNAQKTLLIFCVGVLIIKTTTCLIGITMYSYYKDCDPVKAGVLVQADKLIPYFVNDIIGHIGGMPGIFISCVFSASLSTVSAILHSVSGIIYTDYICRIPSFRHTELKASIIMRALIVLLGLYCILLGFAVEKSTSLFQVQFTLSSILNGAIFGVFTLALFYPWASHKGTVCGALVSIVFMACFVTSAQLYNSAHGTSYKPLPSSTDGCDAMNITGVDTTNSQIDPSLPNPSLSILQTSFQWYPLIGASIVWVVAIVLSHTIVPNRKPIDAKLLSPLVRWRLRDESGQHTELSAIGVRKCSHDAGSRRTSGGLEENVYVVK